MELLAVDRARAAVRDAATRDGSALGSTFGYLPEPQRDLAAPAPPAVTIEIVTRASALDYSDSWSSFKLTPERLTMILRQADWGAPLQLFDMYESTLLADGHTRGLYEQRLDEVCVDWTWRAGDARPGSQQAAEELDAVTKHIDMEGAIEFLALAPFYGCSYIESAWVTRADGRQVPAELVCVPHRRFMFDPQSRPCLTSETNPYPGDQLERRPGSSWMRAETRRWRRQVQAGILRTDSQVLANLVKSGLPVSVSQTREHFGQRAPYGPDDVLKPLEIPDGNAHDPADPREPADPAAS